MAHPSNQLPSQFVLVNAGEVASFPLISGLNQDTGDPITISGNDCFAVYALAASTVTLEGGVYELSATNYGVAPNNLELSLPAGATIYGRFSKVTVSGVGAKVLAYF